MSAPVSKIPGNVYQTKILNQPRHVAAGGITVVDDLQDNRCVRTQDA